MIKRVIFDIDYTLLIPNYEKEKDFFKEYFPKVGSYLMDHIGEVLKEYENTHLKYEEYDFLCYLNQYSQIKLDRFFLQKWFEFNVRLEKQNVEEARNLLEYLKNHNLDIVALSNWFTAAQAEKLNLVGLLDYFDEVYGGDICLKPHKIAYQTAIGNCQPEECLMIGDSLLEDVIAPSRMGLHAIHYTNQDQNHEYKKIKTLAEVKNYL